jgi:uncharacterized protein YdhG (YjbR/CyaY superfamily)
MKKYDSIDEYISDYPAETQVILKKIRQLIRKAAPEAQETLSYGIPTFKLNGNLVHFGGFKNHIGFYPTPRAIEAFKKELQSYEVSKGAIKFPLDKPTPFDLIRRIVELRIEENKSKKS